MPKSKRKGEKIGDDEVPSTIRRSDDKAKRTWKKAHDSAVETYGEGERAHRTAFSALKHTHEKVGDHWEPKDEKGPSDPRAEKGADEARRGEGKTYGGLDVKGHTKKELQERARKLDISGRSKMNKDELAENIAKKEQSQSKKAA